MGSPPGGSTFSTSAPRGTSKEVAYGPGRQMLRSSTRSPERNPRVAAIGPESCSGRRVASLRAGFLLVHRGDRPLRPRGLQRLAPARPSARAVHHRRHRVRPALGAFPALPGGRVRDGRPARPVPLHDALPPPRRERGARILRAGQTAARRGPFLRGSARSLVGTLRRRRPLGRSPGGRLGRGGPVPPGARASTWWSAQPCRARNWCATPEWLVSGSSSTPSSDRTITVTFVDGDLWQASARHWNRWRREPGVGRTTGAS